MFVCVFVCVCVMTIFTGANPLQTQCGPPALATCSEERLPRESSRPQQGEGSVLKSSKHIALVNACFFYGIKI